MKPILYKVGMVCKKHRGCDIVNARVAEEPICAAPHYYELFNSEHKYDLVFGTYRPEMYLNKED